MKEDALQDATFNAAAIQIGIIVSNFMERARGLEGESQKAVLAGLHMALCACLSGLHQFTKLSPEEFGSLCGERVSSMARAMPRPSEKPRTRPENPADVVENLLADIKKRIDETK